MIIPDDRVLGKQLTLFRPFHMGFQLSKPLTRAV